MLTVFFVHGTGVREQAYNDVYALLHNEFATRFPAAALRTCYWGDQCGARFHHDRKSVPHITAEARALEGAADPDVLLWAPLYDDPFFELAAVAALTPAEQEGFTPGATKVDTIVDRLSHWSASPRDSRPSPNAPASPSNCPLRATLWWRADRSKMRSLRCPRRTPMRSPTSSRAPSWRLRCRSAPYAPASRARP